MIKVRFAPSPTGYLHIGGARTALFNWMYAKSQEGKFILRIEDTDRERSKQEFVDEIIDSLAWLGFRYDEIYFQSRRFDVYKEHAVRLLNEGKAYKEGEAVLLKNRAQEIKFFDLIRGEIKFDTSNFVEGQTKTGKEYVKNNSNVLFLKDEVLIKSDGSPAYNFACVVDDALMNITHVIRGEDHISNTPKQIAVYKELGFDIPKFVHLPLIMGEEGGRLSKRTGAAAVSEYKHMGFLPEAIVNYLMLLGWSPGGNQEIVKMEDAVKKFSIKKINKTAAEFSMDKLTWINAQYIKKTPVPKLTELLVPFLSEKGYIRGDFDRKRLESIVKLFQGRMDTLMDFLVRADFAFLEDIKIDPQLKEKYLTEDKAKEFLLFCEKLQGLEEFDVKGVEDAFRNLVAELGIASSDLVHPTRVALTGKEVGPGLFETMAILGKEMTIKRLTQAAQI